MPTAQRQPALPTASYAQVVTLAAGHLSGPDRSLTAAELLPLLPAVWRELNQFPSQAGLDAVAATLARFAAWLPANKVEDLRAVDTACASRFVNGKFDGEPTLEHKHWRRMVPIVTWLTLDHLGIPTADDDGAASRGAGRPG